MAIQVLIERVGKNGYRATSGEPLAVSVEAPTREAAVAKLKKRLSKRLRSAELISVELATPSERNPWVEFAGMFKDDPLIENWKRSMSEYRRQKDAESD